MMLADYSEINEKTFARINIFFARDRAIISRKATYLDGNNGWISHMDIYYGYFFRFRLYLAVRKLLKEIIII